jgi:methyl coenzyme M reductase subunit C
MSASDLFVTKVGPLLSINSIEDVPESWRPDLMVMDTIDRVTIVQAQKSLGVPDDALPTPASLGVFGTSLENLGKHGMRVLRKIRAKQSVIRSLKAHESAGTVPPTLVLRIPASMDTDEYARLGCDAMLSFWRC